MDHCRFSYQPLRKFVPERSRESHVGTYAFVDTLISSLQGTLAPVPVTKLVCDGDAYKCTADLVYTIYLLPLWLFNQITCRTTEMANGRLSGPPPFSTPQAVSKTSLYFWTEALVCPLCAQRD
jgi:hypothetical protein